MSTPDGPRPPEEPTRAMPTAPAPTLTTSPAEGPRRWWAAIPRHLGRARTSTVILAVLFLSIGFLYLYVRPESTGSRPAGDTGDVPVVPAPVTTPLPEPTTTAPATSAPPTSSAPAPTTGGDEEEQEEQPAEPTEDEETPTSEPAETSSTPSTSRTPTSTQPPASEDSAPTP